MTDKEYEALIRIPVEAMKRGITKEEALMSFVDAGIMNEKGEFTEFYSALNGARHLFKLKLNKKLTTNDV